LNSHALEKKAADWQDSHTVERLQSLEREAVKLERRAEASKGDQPPKRARSCAHAAPSCAKLKFPAKRG